MPDPGMRTRGATLPDSAWCPACACVTDPARDGRCVWCDTQTVPHATRRPGGGRKPGFGYLSDAQVHACHILYTHGQSVMAIAAQIQPRTRHASVKSCSMGILNGFVRLGLPRRDRIEATVLAHRTHGLSPKHGPRNGYNTYRRRVLAGQPDQPPCAGVRTGYPRKGAPCSNRAMYGGVYCVAHDPARAEARNANLALARVSAALREEV